MPDGSSACPLCPEQHKVYRLGDLRILFCSEVPAGQVWTSPAIPMVRVRNAGANDA